MENKTAVSCQFLTIKLEKIQKFDNTAIKDKEKQQAKVNLLLKAEKIFLMNLAYPKCRVCIDSTVAHGHGQASPSFSLEQLPVLQAPFMVGALYR